MNAEVNRRYGDCAGVAASAISGGLLLASADHTMLINSVTSLSTSAALRRVGLRGLPTGFSPMFFREAMFITTVMHLGPHTGQLLEGSAVSGDIGADWVQIRWPPVRRVDAHVLESSLRHSRPRDADQPPRHAGRHQPDNPPQLALDGPWGFYFLYAKEKLSAYMQRQMDALPLCDSVSLDPHKAGYCPYGVGVFLLRDESLRRVLTGSAGRVGYIQMHATSATTVEGSRSGAAVIMFWFGHRQMEPLYPHIISRLIDGSRLLQRRLEAEGFEVFKPTDLAFTVFRPHGGHNMPQLAERFCDWDNARNGRVQLVTTDLSTTGEKYFRICTMDPDFVDYCDSFVDKLLSELREYEKGEPQHAPERITA